jgi:hypothetical protein
MEELDRPDDRWFAGCRVTTGSLNVIGPLHLLVAYGIAKCGDRCRECDKPLVIGEVLGYKVREPGHYCEVCTSQILLKYIW